MQALLLGLKVDPNGAAVQIARALPELRHEFERNLDELGLCRTLQLQAAVHWNHAKSAAAEDAWRRAAEHARRVNDRWQLTEILGWLASAALWGPTPALEGIRQCEGYLDEIGNHPSGQAVILLHMAALYAMQDRHRDGTRNAEPRENPHGHPGPDDDRRAHRTRRLHRDARR